MRRFFIAICLASLAPLLQAAAPASAPSWNEKLEAALPLLGHRNWILIVDSAYPLQSAPGIETIDTGAGQLEVVRHVLFALDRSIHVRPLITMDAELPFVPENDAPGVSKYRAEIQDLLHNYPVESVPHNQVIAAVEAASQHFNILVLKTTMAVPYTSVFIRLDCKYWSGDAEQRLRATMAAAPPSAH